MTIYLKVVEFIKGVKGKMMPNIAFEFNRTKATEAILYLANKLNDPGKYVICKLLYLADKCSLEKYGRFIFGDSYSAMREGATPSNAYDLLKEAAKTPVNGISVQGNRVIPLRKPDLDYLSKSDVECLEQIINTPGWRMRRDTHDDAWQKSWDNRGNKESAKIPIEHIAKLFTNSDNLIDYLSNVG